MRMGSGVLLGSILEPILWNILYDGVFSLEYMNGVTAAAYTNDLTLIVEAVDSRDLGFKTNKAL